jgi:hypothetical protein
VGYILGERAEAQSAQKALNGEIFPLFYKIGRKFKDHDF